jgi:hypothetical protein
MLVTTCLSCFQSYDNVEGFCNCDPLILNTNEIKNKQRHRLVTKDSSPSDKKTAKLKRKLLFKEILISAGNLSPYILILLILLLIKPSLFIF